MKLQTNTTSRYHILLCITKRPEPILRTTWRLNRRSWRLSLSDKVFSIFIYVLSECLMSFPVALQVAGGEQFFIFFMYADTQGIMTKK